MLVIGLLGRAGSGKGEIARILREHHNAHEIAFADPLKALAMDLFGLSREQVYGTQAQKEAIDPRHGRSARDIMIALGEGARKHLGRKVWIDALITNIRAHHINTGHKLYTVSDVRYGNECRAILNNGGVVWKVERTHRSSTVELPTERSIDEVPETLIDLHIPNNGTLADLEKQVLEAFHDFRSMGVR